ncbi:hypothetical protein [Tabrizicola flagellatus]|uniref:hypothetical protein n=1 Tax=Tabrizicola flagellatus TaxID=2593021 RepID=UPI0011F276D6|nr:hypothetical protein [Tabrizicola flagellatus]
MGSHRLIMRLVLRWLVRPLGWLAVGGLVAAVALTLWPAPLFPYEARRGDIVLRSDRPLSAGISAVLADVERRIATSDLPAAGPYRVYLCNETWKLHLFGRTLSAGFGGITDVWLTANIFIRPADIDRNAVIPPPTWRFSLEDRPLSYFIAQEITHVQQVAALGRWRYARTPDWLVEGYADHVAKAGEFDAVANLRMLRDGAGELDPRLGLYRRYQLAVEAALQHGDWLSLVTSPPEEADVLRSLLDAGNDP